MKKATISSVALAAGLALCVSPFAAAGDTHAYFGGGFTMANIETENYGDYSLGALDIAGGIMFNGFFGMEARLGMGVSDDTKNVNPGTEILEIEVNTELTNHYGIYLRPQFSADNFHAYALLGYGGADVNMSSPDLPREGLAGSDSGSSYGAGLGWSPDGNLFFSAEYMNYISGKKYDFSGINLRIEFKLR